MNGFIIPKELEEKYTNEICYHIYIRYKLCIEQNL